MTDVENGGAAPAGADAGEAEAWADVERAWLDEGRHRAYVARFQDLEGLAVAGRRYRAVLAARPRDALALTFRDEILRRATALGLAAPPRAVTVPRRATRLVRIAAIALAAVLAAIVARGLVAVLGGRR